jgi:dipeptidyl aminopeptidase/acylaminoacyl peptidase
VIAGAWRGAGAWLVAALIGLAPAAVAADRPATPAAGASVQVVARRAVELPGRRLLALSPDGRRLLARDDDRLCLHDALTLAEERCVAPDTGSIDEGTVAWSPDGRRLAFSEDAARLLVDGDLWLLEAETGRLTNLTDDGIYEVDLFGDDPADPDPLWFDALPTWSPDGRELAFARTIRRDGEWAGTGLYRIAAAGGEPEVVLKLSLEVPFQVFTAMAWTPGGRLVYTVAHPDRDFAQNGVWTVGLDGSGPRHVAETDPDRGYPLLVAVAPAGDAALTIDLAAVGALVAPSPVLSLVDLETGTRTAVDQPVPGAPPATPAGATFAPAGGSILVAFGGAAGRLALRGADGTLETVATGLPVAAAPLRRNLVWAADGTVLVPTGPSSGELLRLDGSGTPVAATPGP